MISILSDVTSYTLTVAWLCFDMCGCCRGGSDYFCLNTDMSSFTCGQAWILPLFVFRFSWSESQIKGLYFILIAYMLKIHARTIKISARVSSMLNVRTCLCVHMHAVYNWISPQCDLTHLLVCVLWNPRLWICHVKTVFSSFPIWPRILGERHGERCPDVLYPIQCSRFTEMRWFDNIWFIRTESAEREPKNSTESNVWL